MNEQPIAIGDMVVILVVEERSTAYAMGLRIGHIGTVVSLSVTDIVRAIFGAECFVEFPTGVCGGALRDLRRIPPPERGSWDYCYWTPPHLRVFKENVT